MINGVGAQEALPPPPVGRKAYKVPIRSPKNNGGNAQAKQRLTLNPRALLRLNRSLTEASRENFNRCLQCRTCSAACPFAWAMDIKPNQVLRHIQFGLLDELMRCSTIWLCVGCHTCTSYCPMAINIPAVMDALRARCLHEGYTPAEPNIVNFHQQVLDSIKRHGRTHKLGIMMRYKLASGELLSDLDLGLKMLSKGKLELKPQTIAELDQIRQMFKEAAHG
jgi:heterodisulfide reductase subunit C